MNDKTSTAKPDIGIIGLVTLLALTCLFLIVRFAGPSILDFVEAVWIGLVDSLTWLIDHSLLPVWGWLFG